MKLALKVIICGGLAFLLGCKSDQREYIDSLQPPGPTKKELAYVEELKSRGFSDVELEIPIIGLSAYGTQTYYVKMNAPFKLTSQNMDSIAKIRQSIALELYKYVVEDSIIFDCREFDIIFKYQDEEFDPYKYESLSGDILKDSLARWSGFKVVKTKIGYNRVSLQ